MNYYHNRHQHRDQYKYIYPNSISINLEEKKEENDG